MEPAGILADIAPTVLSFMDIAKPSSMNGVNLVNNFDHSEDTAQPEEKEPEQEKK